MDDSSIQEVIFHFVMALFGCFLGIHFLIYIYYFLFVLMRNGVFCLTEHNDT